MANNQSAEKRIRQTKKRTIVNRARTSQLKTALRKVEEAITAGDKAVALTVFREAESELVRTAQKGLIHRNKAARKASRLSARIKAL